jgi:hypothetical protein
LGPELTGNKKEGSGRPQENALPPTSESSVGNPPDVDTTARIIEAVLEKLQKTGKSRRRPADEEFTEEYEERLKQLVCQKTK